MQLAAGRIAAVWCAVAAAAALGLGAPVQSMAEPATLSDAEAQLSAKVDELNQLTSQLEQANDELAQLQEELDSLKSDIADSQADYATLQHRFANMSVLMYKTDDVGILQMLTDSATLGELLSRISQLEAVTQQAANLANEQKELSARLQSNYDEVSQRKTAAERSRADLEVKRAAVDVARERLAAQVADMQAAAAAAAAQAALQAAQQASDAATATVAAATTPAQPAPAASDASAQEQPVAQQDQAQEQPATQQEAVQEQPVVQDETPAEQQAATFSTADTGGWSTGLASAYGGASDPSVPNPGVTATGAVCDDYSMGVAVPLAWGPAAYYGRQIEISYNGQSVIVTVNDCGGLGGGARSLDLQPGVFKAFGFSTCQDWGVRTVSYRFL